MHIFELLFSTIAPHQCLVCKAEGGLLCKTCQISLPCPPKTCYRCAVSTQQGICTRCSELSPLKSLSAATTFSGVAQQLVHALKFGRAPAAAIPMAKRMCQRPVPHCTVVTNVPTATSRVRRRGYDQSALLAKHISKILGAPYVPLLARFGQQRQLGQNREKRQQQLEAAFYVPSSRSCRNTVVLLIDDVITTGSTLEGAAQALYAAGAGQVHGGVFAIA